MILRALATLLALVSCVAANSVKNSSSIEIVETFHNPILDFVSPDPQILYHNGFYYMVLSSNQWPYRSGGILVYKYVTQTIGHDPWSINFGDLCLNVSN